MSLKDLELDRSYDSDEDDIVNEFLVPVLGEAKEYLRLAGYFSSSTLAVSAKGLSEFIEKEGKMKLVVGADLRRKDLEIIKDAYLDPETVIKDNMLDELERVEKGFEKDHVEALGWMVANGLLDIKVALVRNSEGRLVPAEDAEGIFHQKVGVVSDSIGNRLSFSGSDNETARGWLGNIEEFKVFKEWKGGDQKFWFKEDYQKFQKFWNNESIRVEVKEIPEAVKEELISIAPDDKGEINLKKWQDSKPEKKENNIELWDNQREAIERWMDNDKQGIWRMATGTGKTYAALGSVKHIEDDSLVVISCPTNPLVEQWKEEISEFGFDDEVIVCSSMNRGWKDDLQDAIFDLESGRKNKVFALTTHDTLSSLNFRKIVNRADITRYLIADEVHGLGAEKRQEGLMSAYKYRLGLSATPHRWLDEEGTDTIFEYFGEKENEPTYEFGMDEAINNTNPETGETYLCPYDYKPRFVGLTPDELEDYREQTKNLVRSYQNANKEERDEIVQKLASKRARIIKDAENKYEELNNVLDEIDDFKHTLFYVSPDQLPQVQEYLNERKIDQHKITQNEGQVEKEQYDGLTERKFILRNFANGNYESLVSIKILDEGIDIPATKRAVLMSNTGNPRQYIQRRGRVLRHSQNKEKATIYDLIVVPSLDSRVNKDLFDLERKIMKKELKRFKEFSDLAENSLECYEKIEKVEQKYDIIV